MHQTYLSGLLCRSATYGGGGVKALQSAVVIINCLIADNTSPAGAGLQTDREYSPGDVYDATFVITDSTVSGNIATQTGGGMSAASMDLLSMTNVTFTRNKGTGCQVAHAWAGALSVRCKTPSRLSVVVRSQSRRGHMVWRHGAHQLHHHDWLLLQRQQC